MASELAKSAAVAVSSNLTHFIIQSVGKVANSANSAKGRLLDAITTLQARVQDLALKFHCSLRARTLSKTPQHDCLRHAIPALEVKVEDLKAKFALQFQAAPAADNHCNFLVSGFELDPSAPTFVPEAGQHMPGAATLHTDQCTMCEQCHSSIQPARVPPCDCGLAASEADDGAEQYS
eukprot:UN2727